MNLTWWSSGGLGSYYSKVKMSDYFTFKYAVSKISYFRRCMV